MFPWNCQHCKMSYYALTLCVYHEMHECEKNPKFKYRIESEKHDKLDEQHILFKKENQLKRTKKDKL